MSARGPRSIIIRPDSWSDDYFVVSTVNLVEPKIDETLTKFKVQQFINNGIKVTIRKEK